MRAHAINSNLRRGFSLIEILIAVIILALGLLGLGAVFPVVIREQKIAQDRISGTLAENNVRALLGGIDRLNQPAIYTFTTNNRNELTGEIVGNYTGWAVLKEEWTYYEAVNEFLDNPPAGEVRPDFINRFQFSRDGLWETDWGRNQQAPSAATEYADTGDIAFVDRDNNIAGQEDQFPRSLVQQLQNLLAQTPTAPGVSFARRYTEFRFPLSQRINPAGDPGNDSPTHVWDFAVRRRLESPDPRALQVAVFIRRIDPRLRPVPRPSPTPGNTEISVREQIFSTTLPPARQRLPLGEDNDGLPTLDGTDGSGDVFYSGIHTVDADFRVDPLDPVLRKRDRIYVSGGVGRDLDLVRQIGQRVIDNLGNIYTVVGIDGQYIKVDPPVPSSVLETPQNNDPELVAIRQLAFTPQIPVAAFVLEVEP